MRTSLTKSIVLTAAVLAGALGASLPDRSSARADGASCAAIVAGVDAGSGTAPELVVWNAGASELSLDLVLRGEDGAVVVTRPAAVVAGGFHTVRLDLNAELRKDLPRGQKPYAGLLTVELRGVAPFDSGNAIVHVTQYYGTRKKPRVAYVLRALFRDETNL